MTILSILLALIVERVMPQTIELRRFDWLRGYNQWLDGVLHIGSLGAWGSFAIILLPLLISCQSVTVPVEVLGHARLCSKHPRGIRVEPLLNRRHNVRGKNTLPG